MLFHVCTKCEEAKWLHNFRLRFRNGDYHYRSWCKDCESLDSAKRVSRKLQNNPELKKESLARLTKWGKENKVRRRKADADRCKTKYAEDTAYRASVVSCAAKRRATKLKATPAWLSEVHKAEIENIYEVCAKVSEKTGKPHDVDHIVPLQGENVCGLHVPWNLRILPASLNRSKGNAFNSWADCNP